MQKKIDIYQEPASTYTGPVKKVSVIIPNYNYEKFIIERIDSILRQSYPIYELIILDDCSTDDSARVIQEKLATIKDIKTRFVPNKKNSGSVFSQWQKGMNLATGDYVWIAEADDSASPKFLETAMAGFEHADHPNVIISYTDSMRMDDENNILERHTRPTIHQEGSYIVDGKKEIERCFAVSNTIFNVSSVVWRKGDYDKFFEEAKKFVVAGDWYIYYKLMEIGDIAYDNHALNYFRKHDSSVSTTVKDDIEYGEIRKIQDEIAQKYPLSNRTLMHQRSRLNVMDKNVSKDVHKKRIAWVIPEFDRGSGGHRTIFQNVNALAKAGYECDMYIMGMKETNSEDIKTKIIKYYEYPIAEVYVGFTPQCQDYDLCFCTGWQTIDAVELFQCPKAYFIQDFEPWFFPMSGQYLLIENSYRRGYTPISIGKWLAHKMDAEYHAKAQYFDFCADLDVYSPNSTVERENAICAIYQPEKSRRCQEIMVAALKIVQKLRPNTKIYLYGTMAACPDNLEAEMVGMVSPQECSALYRKCSVGLCMSASNPSRIPFEMMATGLPVVDLYLENNIYDIPDEAALLAQASPDAVAEALIQLLDNKSARSKMGKAGAEYMSNKPIEKGYEQFVQAVNHVLDIDHAKPATVAGPAYKKTPVQASEATKSVLSDLTLADLKWIESRCHYKKSKVATIKDLGYRALRKGYRILRKFV